MAGHSARLLLLGPTLACSLVSPATAQAEATSWLAWSPPPECPTALDIERRVTQWLGGALPSDADLSVRTALAWNGERWEVTVEIAFEGESGQREVAVRDCQEAADFVAITVALAVDPSLAEKVNPSAPGAPATEPGTSHAAAEPPDEPPEPAPLPAPPPAATGVPSSAANERSPFRPYASASAEAATGVLPEPALGLGIAVGGDVGRLSLSLGTRWFPATSTHPEQAVAPIEFSLLGARLRGAYLFFGPEARVGPSVAVDAGAIQAKQLRSGDERVVEPWISLGAGALGLVALGTYVSVFGEFEAEVPLTRPTFVLNDESVVHQVGLGARAALGLRFSFLGQ